MKVGALAVLTADEVASAIVAAMRKGGAKIEYSDHIEVVFRIDHDENGIVTSRH
jgi:hypothetical protein